ncbi:MAG: hypothetical protein HQ523_10580 [Lentisphaerae bacterium]|nr:hypothetical protein [Lentisphaerota bacterium]
MRRRRQNQMVVDGVVAWTDGLRWWQLPKKMERTHRGAIRHVLLMLI